MSISIASLKAWMSNQGWTPYSFQQECWKSIRDGHHGVLNAPTGSGKTYAVFLGCLLRAKTKKSTGVRVLWITPLRALAHDIAQAMSRACTELDVNWSVGVRTSDTPQSEKKRQRTSPPEVLVTTPESIHVLFSYTNSTRFFESVDVVVVDEWHELVGNKRGVQTELALARIRACSPKAVVWGISATIGNLDEAMHVLLGTDMQRATVVKAKTKKKTNISTLMPKTIERFPWTGHLGIRLLHDAERVVKKHTSTLVFTNTRSQAEIWYQRFLDEFPEYAGRMALHHGSLDRDVREWVEASLKTGKLSVVFCTSSLDLGVDFAPVDAVIQVGSPKGVARFLQRAGRSGHNPTATSTISFLPTHALEIIEGAAMRAAVTRGVMEDRVPHTNSIDVLCQWLVTLACGDGFNAKELRKEVCATHAYSTLSKADWEWVLNFITKGGESLRAYDEFQKVIEYNNTFVVADRRIAMRHRMQIGTIVSDAAVHVQLVRSKRLGTIEESFISRLETGDRFWFAGQCLEFVELKEMTAFVVKSKNTKGAIPRWTGGRLPLSSQMSEVIRSCVHDAANGVYASVEMKRIKPLLELQNSTSRLPQKHQLLIEQYQSSEGYHVFIFPFEGRLAHEGLAALFAMRLSRVTPITFSLAMNDYGFELLSDKPIPLQEGIGKGLFSLRNVSEDILQSANVTQMARRGFRQIARIAGLVFQGYPTKMKRSRHLQASSELFFDVFRDYDASNLLLKQAIDETLAFQLDEDRIRDVLHRISFQEVLIQEVTKPTPFAVPILVDRLREKVGSERMEELVMRMLRRAST